MTEPRSYWLNLFSSKSWAEFLAAGGTTTGFRRRRWKMVQRIKLGDQFLCYLTGLSRWVGLLEATSPPFVDDSQIWAADPFPARIKVRSIIQLTPETAVPIFDLRQDLSFFRNLTNPNAWTGHLRGSPAKLSHEDALAIILALEAANKNPIKRKIDKAKLRRVSPYLRSGSKNDEQSLSLPDPLNNNSEGIHSSQKLMNREYENIEEESITKPSLHTRIQWVLLKLGADMGLDVWAATSDRSKEYEGQVFSNLKNLRRKLPRQFDRETSRTVSQIDVLWIKNDAIIMAFEIESTTTIYSGLLRMSDLLARKPHLNIPLFIIAPQSRRDKIVREINRPTFVSLQTPLRDVCQFISFEDLDEFDARIRAALPSLAVLNPDVLQQIASSAASEDDEYEDE